MAMDSSELIATLIDIAKTEELPHDLWRFAHKNSQIDSKLINEALTYLDRSHSGLLARTRLLSLQKEELIINRDSEQALVDELVKLATTHDSSVDKLWRFAIENTAVDVDLCGQALHRLLAEPAPDLLGITKLLSLLELEVVLDRDAGQLQLQVLIRKLKTTFEFDLKEDTTQLYDLFDKLKDQLVDDETVSLAERDTPSPSETTTSPAHSAARYGFFGSGSQQTTTPESRLTPSDDSTRRPSI